MSFFTSLYANKKTAYNKKLQLNVLIYLDSKSNCKRTSIFQVNLGNIENQIEQHFEFPKEKEKKLETLIDGYSKINLDKDKNILKYYFKSWRSRNKNPYHFLQMNKNNISNGKNDQVLTGDIKGMDFNKRISGFQSKRININNKIEEIEDEDFNFLKNYFEVRDKFFTENQTKTYTNYYL